MSHQSLQQGERAAGQRSAVELVTLRQISGHGHIRSHIHPCICYVLRQTKAVDSVLKAKYKDFHIKRM